MNETLDQNVHLETVWFQLIASTAVKTIPVQVNCENTNCSNGNSNLLYTLTFGGTPDNEVKMCTTDPNNIHENIKQKVLIPLTILILVSNLAVLVVFAVSRKFHTPAYCLIANLGVADLLVGVVSIGTMATHATESTLDFCLIRIGFTIACCVCSILCLMSIAIERYIAITFSLRYKEMVTKQKTLSATSLSWIVSLLVGFAPLLGWRVRNYEHYCSFLYVLPADYILFLFTSCVLLPIVIMTAIYGKIFRNVRVHIKRIEAIENLHITRRSSGPVSARTLRSIKTMSAVFGCLILTWLPFLCTTVTQIIYGDVMCYLKDIIGTHLLLLGFCNSFLNPIIYAIGTRDFREKLRETIKRHRRI